MVMKLDGYTAPGWVEFWEVPSQSSAGTAYIVARRVLGQFGCSCPQWKFKHKPCKHIDIVKDFIINPDKYKPHTQVTTPEKVKKLLGVFEAIEL